MSTPGDEPADPLARVRWPLRTERLTIRRVAAADEGALWRIRRLEEFSRWGGWRPADRADWHELLTARLHKVLVIELDGRVVGDLMVSVVDGWSQREVAAAARGTQAELAWAIDPALGGRGYATEAVRELLRACFEEIGLRRVTAGAFLANEPSWRLMERVGMRREEHRVRESLHRELGWLDAVGYALLAEEWRAQQPTPGT